MYILGLSCFYHDAAVCLFKNGVPLLQLMSKRSLEKNMTISFPEWIRWALEEAGIGVEDIKAVAFYDKPLIKLERIIKSHLRTSKELQSVVYGCRVIWNQAKT